MDRRLHETDLNGRKAKNIRRVRAVFADLDGSPLEPVLAYPLKPHLVYETSPRRYHAYWFVDGIKLVEFEKVQNALINLFNSDKVVKDLPRVMRVPGFLHMKDKPYLSRLYQQNEMPNYTAETIRECFPISEPNKPQKANTDKFDVNKLKSALVFLSAKEYCTWRDVGIAIKTTAQDTGYPDDQARELWTNWSREKAEGAAFSVEACEGFWSGLVPRPMETEDRITVGSIYHLAKEAGWSSIHRETIIMSGGNLSAIVDQAENALIELGTPIYQRGEELVRPIKLGQEKSESGIKRTPGATVLHSVTGPWLIEQMGQAASWITIRRTPKDEVIETPHDPFPKYATTLLNRVGHWKFPVLRAVITCPTLDRDGRIIETPGYDPLSALFLDFEHGSFPPIPRSPSKEDAKGALDLLLRPLRGFPWASPQAKSVALSAMLTGLVRPSLRTSPLHGFDAPTAGTGKSLLAEIPGLLAMGVKPPAMSQGKTPEEDEKRLSTILHAGDPVILVDNCEQAITGDFLCSMLTQETVQARILGQSERRILPCTALVLVTGNNLTFAGDISRRSLVCRLDAKEERPDQRKFDFDCQLEVIQSRPALVVAGLTVLLAYHLAGRPADLTPMGSFNDYEWVRGALVWLGEADPAATREAILDSDPRKNELIEIMKLWATVYGNKPVVIGDISNFALGDLNGQALKNALTDIACQNRTWSSKSVGKWMSRNKGKIISGKHFQRIEGNHTAWSLDETQGSLPF